MTPAEQPEKPIIFYSTPDGAVKAKLLYDAESFWLPQEGIARLFGVGKPAISKHLKNIFAEGELPESSVVSKMETTASDGKNYRVAVFSQEIGFRGRSSRGTQKTGGCAAYSPSVFR